MPPIDLTDPDEVNALIHWGKTLCLPQQSDVEWRVWQLATTLDIALNALEHVITITQKEEFIVQPFETELEEVA